MGVTRLLQSDSLCRRIASAALNWVTAHHDWETQLDALERVVLGEHNEQRTMAGTSMASPVVNGASITSTLAEISLNEA